MLTKKKARPRIPPNVAAIVRPINTRLSRMEDLLVEMRAEQDLKLKKIKKLQEQVSDLTETIGRRLVSVKDSRP